MPFRIVGIVAVVASMVPAPSALAAGEEFYRNLLRRGMAQVQAGEYEAALRPLKIAAFGFVSSIDEFETAYIYLAVAHDALKRPNDARVSAQRVIAAEAIARRYARLQIPEVIRTRFEAVAERVLTPGQLASLRGTPAPAPSIARQQPLPGRPEPAPSRTATPTPATPASNGPPPPPTPAPQPVTVRPAPPPTPAPAPAPVRPAPAPAPVRPAPAPPVPAGVDSELELGNRALAANDLMEARAIFLRVLRSEGLTRDQRMAVASGLTRARDFENAVEAFRRLGAFRSREEPYRYYYAIALHETGQHGAARRELTAALPHIQITPEVERWRAKIESAGY